MTAATAPPQPNPRVALERKLRDAEERVDQAANAIVRELHGKPIWADSIQRERSRLEQALVEAAGWKRCIKALDDLEREERRG